MTARTAGFVGLGYMGLPMARNLIKGGWEITAWNRSEGALRELGRLGGRAPASVASLRDQPVIVFMLPDLPYIEEAAGPLLDDWRAKPPAPGTAVVIMSSVSPTGVQRF